MNRQMYVYFDKIALTGQMYTHLYGLIMKKIPPYRLLSCLATLALATITQAATLPYTGWIDDYTGTEAHTLGLWKFDDSQNYGVNSASNSPYHEMNMSFASKGVEVGAPGKFGTSFFSRGTDNEPGRSIANDSHATLAGSPALFNGSALSIEFWYSPVVPAGELGAGYSYFFDKMKNDPTGVQLRLNNTNEPKQRLTFTVGNGDKVVSANTRELTWEVGAWYHIAVTFENVNGDGVLKIFRDGEELASTVSVNFGDMAAGTQSWRVANRLVSSYSSVPGYYDNFRVSDIAYSFAPVPEPRGIAFMLLLVPLVWRAVVVARTA